MNKKIAQMVALYTLGIAAYRAYKFIRERNDQPKGKRKPNEFLDAVTELFTESKKLLHALVTTSTKKIKLAQESAALKG